MATIGAIRNTQKIPNAKQPSDGPGTRATFALRVTPKPFTVITQGSGNQDFVISAYKVPSFAPAYRPSRTFKGAGVATAIHGESRLDLSVAVATRGQPFQASISEALTVTITTHGVVPTQAGETHPSPVFAAAFSDAPLERNPNWSDLSTRLRGVSTKRGRSYEFDRMETGTLSSILSNRDSALNPENTASPYTPIRSTRPVLGQLVWESTIFPLFRGISEGFPQAYPELGLDAFVELQANDLFYALNNARFNPGSTVLGGPMTVVPQNREETITVAATGLPLPQAAPFTITVAGLAGGWPPEEMEVTEVLSATQYRVLRDAETTYEHPAGAAVTTTAISFGEESSGVRIQNVLLLSGFPLGAAVYPWPTEVLFSQWWELDTGQSIIAASGDLSQVSPLEHINLITEAEFGRFFVSRDGKFTFRDRHSVILDSLTPAFTFRDGADTSAGEVPYVIEGALQHSDEKLYNRVKITIPAGSVVDLIDQASVTQHFERIFERELPYADLNDAVSAAHFVLARQSEDTLRLPSIIVHGAKDPETLWPLLLTREIGDRCRFRYQPDGGGDEVDKDVVIEGISHSLAPKEHQMSFDCTEVDANQYWILGMAGYSELGETSWAAF